MSPISRLQGTFGLHHHSYADDATLILSADSVTSPLSLLESCTSAPSDWFSFNGLQLNPSKSEILLVGSREKRRLAELSFSSNLTIACSTVPLSSTTKILGLVFDSSLSFDSHISEVCRSANYHLSALAHKGSVSFGFLSESCSVCNYFITT